MKLIQNLALCFLPAIVLFSGLAGCASPPRPVHLLGSGYQEVEHRSKSLDSPDDVRLSLEYRSPEGNIDLIWPSLSGVDEVIKGDVAIFVGEKAYVTSDPDNPRGMEPRLFAVQAPALPLDITDQILWGWSKGTGKDFAKAMRLLEMLTPVENGGKLEVQLEFWEDGNGWPDNSTLQLDWNQVFEIMHTVKEKGTMHKDLRWGTPYIEN